VLKPQQLEILAILKQIILVNLTFYLNSLLHDVARRVRIPKDPHSVASHHGLIKLIIKNRLAQQQLTWDSIINRTLAPPLEKEEIERKVLRNPGPKKILKQKSPTAPLESAKCRLLVRVKWCIPIQVAEARPSHTSPLIPQDPPLQNYEDEVARFLGSMGMFIEGREQLGNTEEHNYTPDWLVPVDNSCHEQTQPCVDAMEEQRELIPDIETPLEAEEYEETPTERNPEDENLKDSNQPRIIPFSKSPMDEAYQEEDHENDDYSRDTIALGSFEHEMNNNYELEGEILLENTVPTGNIFDNNIMQPIHVVEGNVAPYGSPRVEEP